MNTKTNKSIHDLQRETVYKQIQKDPNYAYALFNGKVAIESQRKSNYKTTARAGREIIDNAIEAGGSGTNIYVLIEKWGDEAPRGIRKTTVRRIYFYDDGPGMFHDDNDHSMLRFALTWGGGTNHENPDREIGRFGFGLPNASISQCRKTSVYSCEDGKEWNVGILDIDSMNEFGMIEVPEISKAALPKFVQQWAKKNKIDTSSGTCVVWDECDSLSTATAATLKEDLIYDFSMTYRNYLDVVSIYVDSKDPIEKIDPTFLDPDARYYVPPVEDIDDPTSGGARLIFNKTIDVKYWKDKNTSAHNVSLIPDRNAMEDAKKQLLDPHGDMTDVAIGKIRIRIARLPLGFAELQKEFFQDELSNERLNIRSNQKGFHFVRSGREIDVCDVAPKSKRAEGRGLGNWIQLQNYSYHFPVEFTFDPSLDEIFQVSNDKQSVKPVEEFWKLMSSTELKVDAAIARENRWQTNQRKVRQDNKKNQESNVKVALDQVIEGEKSTLSKTKSLLDTRKSKQKRFEAEAKKTSESKNIKIEEARALVSKSQEEKPLDYSFVNIEGGDFMMPKYIENLTIQLNINEAHDFYKHIYSPASQQVKNGLLLMLYFFAKQELELADADPGSPEASTLKFQRQELSRYLSARLGGVDLALHDKDLQEDD